jgi:hypothetical protein
MRTLVIELDDEISAWIERRRGRMGPEDFAGRALREYVAIDEKGLAVRFARAHEEMADQLNELQRRIRRLDESLQDSSAMPAKDTAESLIDSDESQTDSGASICLYRGRRK